MDTQKLIDSLNAMADKQARYDWLESNGYVIAVKDTIQSLDVGTEVILANNGSTVSAIVSEVENGDITFNHQAAEFPERYWCDGFMTTPDEEKRATITVWFVPPKEQYMAINISTYEICAVGLTREAMKDYIVALPAETLNSIRIVDMKSLIKPEIKQVTTVTF